MSPGRFPVCGRVAARHCEAMTFLPGTWTNVLISDQHLAIYCTVLGLIGLAVFGSVPGTWTQRLWPAAAAAAATAVISPFLVSPVYLSEGLWTWGLALVGATSLTAACLTHAVRAAMGCILSSRIEWSAWIASVASSWLAMLLAGAHSWALACAATLVITYFIAARLLPAHITSTTRNDELVKVSILVALPAIVTGVPWAGLVVLSVAVVAGAISSRSKTQARRLEVARTSVVTTHALTGVLPLALLMLGAPTMPLYL